MSKRRAFIAVAVSHSVRTQVARLLRELQQVTSEVKWVVPENLHFTLHFLGDVENREVLQLHEMLRKATAQIRPFRLGVGTIGAFPSIEKPRTLWVGVEKGEAAIQELQQAIAEPLQELGFRTERRRYRPHLTLGRVAANANLQIICEKLATTASFSAGEMEVDQICLMASQLTRQTQIYHELASVDFVATN